MQGAEPSTSASASATRRRSVSPALPCVLLDKDCFMLCDVRVRVRTCHCRPSEGRRTFVAASQPESRACRADVVSKRPRAQGKQGWTPGQRAGRLGPERDRRASAPRACTCAVACGSVPASCAGLTPRTTHHALHSRCPRWPRCKQQRNRHAARASCWSQDMCPLARNGPLARTQRKERPIVHGHIVLPLPLRPAACALRSARLADVHRLSRLGHGWALPLPLPLRYGSAVPGEHAEGASAHWATAHGTTHPASLSCPFLVSCSPLIPPPAS